MIHPDDAAALGDRRRRRGRARQRARQGAPPRPAVRRRAARRADRGIALAQLRAYADGRGINTLTGADPVAPFGGAAFHDNKVWLKRFAA